jgi:SET domain-containing protein
MMIRLGIKIKKAGNKGRGVFATKRFKKGETIEVSPYIETLAKDYKKLSVTRLMYYWYGVRGKKCAIGLGFTSLYNHSLTPNSYFVVREKSKTIKITAHKDIAIGEEICFNYGYNPLED